MASPKDRTAPNIVPSYPMHPQTSTRASLLPCREIDAKLVEESKVEGHLAFDFRLLTRLRRLTFSPNQTTSPAHAMSRSGPPHRTHPKLLPDPQHSTCRQ